MFYLGFVGILIFTVIVSVNSLQVDEGLSLLYYSKTQYLMIFCGCLFDALSINCLVFAFQLSSSSFVSIFTYLAIVYSMISDKFIFGDVVVMRQMIAAIVIVISTFIVSVYKTV